MSVLSHLDKLGSNLILSTNEKSSITTSISTLETRLGYYFNTIESSFVFGSYDRVTILPRSVDSNSDIDYMIIFNDGGDFKPQTLLSRLKRFVDTYYSTSEVFQSSPTMVLKLNHIKFELVPAYKSWGTIYIPAPSSDYQDWTSTNPSQMKTDLTNKNTNCNYKIKPLVRVLKYWNVLNGKVYTSYELEKYIVDKLYFFDTNLKDYFFSAVNGLPTYGLPDYKKRKVERLQENIKKVQENLNDEMPYTAESKLKEELPDL
ncbi:SMODS domain-containing nucleotidyltransferase [Marinifilum sp. RC60d5]|uniref:SMODS domain-containing nucleotidyltransferase n=1 Tax=Marinifilum sp. RC60d5 TaxID=3458414 RepID=UPI004036D9F0